MTTQNEIPNVPIQHKKNTVSISETSGNGYQIFDSESAVSSIFGDDINVTHYENSDFSVISLWQNGKHIGEFHTKPHIARRIEVWA